MGLFKQHDCGATSAIMSVEQSRYLSHLFGKAKREYIRLIPLMARYGLSRVLRRPLNFNKFDLSDLMISIDPHQGIFLYQQILSKKPLHLFEFGLSHGISAIYMALALERLNQGVLHSTELEVKKVAIAKKHIDFFQLNERIDIMPMDVFKAIEQINTPVDMVHMDGYPGLNLQVLQALESKLSPNALIITDDCTLFNLEMRDYIHYLATSKKYCNVLLKNSTGILVSTYLN